MKTLQFREAICEAMSEEMRTDESIYLMGEEVAEYNGAYKASKGMLKVINSIIGLLPNIADPTPIPEKPSSEIGVSITRSAPNSSNIPLDALYAPLYLSLIHI